MSVAVAVAVLTFWTVGALTVWALVHGGTR